MNTVATVRICLGLALVVGAAPCLSAQTPGGEASAAPVGAGVYKLKLESVPEIEHGKTAIVEGVVGPSGQKLAVADLAVLQPVEVMLFTPAADDDVRIELSKFILDGPARSGSTKGEGFVSFKFRTQGDLQIKLVSPNGPTVYRLFVWAGNEISPPMPSVFMSMGDYLRRQAPAASGGVPAPAAATGSPFLLWVIAGALVIIVGLLGVLVLKRGRS